MDYEFLIKTVDYDAKTGVMRWLSPLTKSIKAGTIAKSINKDGYLQIRIAGKMYVQHRLAWMYVYGSMPDGDIDHINHDRTDNRIDNLRVVTKRVNNKNLSMRSNNTSGVTGVWWGKHVNKWVAEIHPDGKKIHLGVFDCLSDAAEARKVAELKYGFHENHGDKKCQK